MNKIDSIKIGNFLKTLRCDLKLSQDDLANKLQLKLSAIGKMGRHYLILIKFLRYVKF